MLDPKKLQGAQPASNIFCCKQVVSIVHFYVQYFATIIAELKYLWQCLSFIIFIVLVPGSVFDLHAAEVAATFISVAWKKPQQPNGIITQYRVKVLVEDTGETLEDTILTEKIKVM